MYSVVFILAELHHTQAYTHQVMRTLYDLEGTYIAKA